MIVILIAACYHRLRQVAEEWQSVIISAHKCDNVCGQNLKKYF